VKVRRARKRNRKRNYRTLQSLARIRRFGLASLRWPLLKRSIPSKREECSMLADLSRILFSDCIRAGRDRRLRLPLFSEQRQPFFISLSEADTGTYAGREESNSVTCSNGLESSFSNQATAGIP